MTLKNIIDEARQLPLAEQVRVNRSGVALDATVTGWPRSPSGS